MHLKSQWRKGPIESIPCTPAHGQPIFSMAVSSQCFVTGSADHGLREYSLETGKYLRELFGKKYGHKEWVSTCAYTPSGRVISGGMDSVVCYWDSKAVRCYHFLGHQGSISKVMADERIGISASYDATIMLWDLANKEKCETLLGPHKQAIMYFEWSNSLLVSGDKAGVVAIWDLNKLYLVRAIKTHRGAVSAVKFHTKNGLISTAGLNDGSVACIDMRTNCPINHYMIHKGSVNALKVVEEHGLLLSCSADGSIVMRSIPEFKNVLTLNAGDMVFSLYYALGVLIGGSGKGNILAYDILTGDSLYGYGVMKKGACRLLKKSTDNSRLVCAGEDEGATLLVWK